MEDISDYGLFKFMKTTTPRTVAFNRRAEDPQRRPRVQDHDGRVSASSENSVGSDDAIFELEGFAGIVKEAFGVIMEGMLIVDQSMEIVFSNESAAEILEVRSTEHLNDRHLTDFLGDNHLQIQRCIAEGGWDNQREIEVRTAEGNSRVVLTTVSSRYSNGMFYGAFVTMMDITKQKTAESDLRYRIEMERLITSVSSDFTRRRCEEVDEGIHRGLERIGRFAGVDRSYVFLMHEDGTAMDNTHEWCNSGIEPQRDFLQALPVEAVPWWMQQLKELQNIYIPFVSELPPEAHLEKEIFEQQDIRSLIVVPMVRDESLVGFLGFDSVRTSRTWSDDTIAMLRMVAEVFSSALERRESVARLRASNDELMTKQVLLTEKNTALSHVLNQFEVEKQQIAVQIQSNIDRVVMPLLGTLKNRADGVDQKYLDLLGASLTDIAAPFVNKLESLYSKLSPRDTEVCTMIRNGLSSKEIAVALGISVYTVHNMRARIRKKLNLIGDNSSLSEFLLSV